MGCIQENEREKFIHRSAQPRQSYHKLRVFRNKTRALISTLLAVGRKISGLAFPLLLAALYLIYLFVGKLVAVDLVNITEKHLGNEIWEPWIRSVVTHFHSLNSWLALSS